MAKIDGRTIGEEIDKQEIIKIVIRNIILNDIYRIEHNNIEYIIIIKYILMSILNEYI